VHIDNRSGGDVGTAAGSVPEGPHGSGTTAAGCRRYHVLEPVVEDGAGAVQTSTVAGITTSMGLDE